MDTASHNSELVTMHEIASVVNNENMKEEIVVFDHDVSIRQEDIFPHKYDALVIVLCTDGSGKIGIDLKEYDIKKNTLLVLQPKNYVFSCELDPSFKSSVMVCSRRLIEDVLPKLTEILPLLLYHRTEPVTLLSEDEAAGIKRFYEFLATKLHGSKTRFINQKIHAMLQSMLYEMMDIHDKHSSNVEENSRTRKEELMAKFILAVSEEFRTQRQVAYYAQKLCISPKYLSSVVKEISGRTAGEWIENYVILESKVLLKTTDMTIQEVAVYMNFANQSFFGKYFKQHTGLSPTSYRKQFS